MCPWCVSQISSLLTLHVSQIKITCHLYPSTSWVSSSKRSLEFSDLMFFCRTMKVMSFSLFDSLVVLSALILLLLVSLLSFSIFLSSFYCHPHIFSTAATLSVFLWFRFFFINFLSHTQWNVSLNVTITMSVSVFSSRSVSFFDFISVSFFLYVCTMERHRQCIWELDCLLLFLPHFRVLVLCVSLAPFDYA